MLTHLIDLCLRHRAVVLILAAGVVAAGLAAFRELPFDAFPDTTPVQVAVNTTAAALAPLEVERQITAPVEQAIGGLPGLVEVRSLSKFGFSQVTAIFEDGTDLWLARQVLSERLGTVSLPDGVSRPTLGPVATGLGEVFQYLVTSDTLSPAELRTLHHWVIRPQMLQVPGVAEINTWGGKERQLHVILDPQQLLGYGLTLDDLAEALHKNNRNVGGGSIDVAGEGMLVQGTGLVRSANDVRGIVVATVNGTPVRVGDVARVEEGAAIRRGAVTAEGQGEAVLGLGLMLMGENSHEVTRRLQERLALVQSDLARTGDVELTPVYSRTDIVDRVLETVRDNLLVGALLVVAVLFAFLGSVRAGLIVALAIPLSLLFAFDAMVRFGITGTLMSLGAIDFGLVVDSSVILVENAQRRLAEDASGRSVREVVRDAAVEVRKPTLFGELIIAVVYLPILALEGVEGQMFRPMALTVIFALFGSMILSLTVMPVLASLVLRRGAAHGDTWLSRALLAMYRPVLRAALRWRAVVLGVAVLAVAVAAILATRLGSEFVPQLREHAIVINTVRAAGISLDESVRYGTGMERLLQQQFPDEVAHVWTRTGTAEVATDPMGLEVSDVFVTLTDTSAWTRARTQDELEQRMADAIEGLPGMRAVFTQPIEMRLNEMTAGIRADVGVKIFGDDLDLLQVKAEEVARIVGAIPGATDVSVEQLTGLAVLSIDVNREEAGRHGLSVDQVLGVVESLGTRIVGEVTEDQTRYDLVIRLPDDVREDPDRLGRLPLLGPDGRRVLLSQVARITVTEGPSTVQREWGKRRVVVQANVRDRDVGSFVADVDAALHERLDLPEGSWWRLGGQFEHLERAQKRLLIVVPVALLLVLGLLYVTYGRVLDALRVFTGVPFAAVGGVVALWARDLPFSVSAAVGFVALFGVAVLGDMVLVSRVRQLVARGVERMDAIRQAAETRLRPVLMTGLVACLGFLPMALNTGLGAEVQRPLATVVAGGIVTATLATLLVLPVLYSAFGARTGPRTQDVTQEISCPPN